MGGDLKSNDNIKISKWLEWKRARYSRNFNFKTWRNLIVLPLVVTTMSTFFVLLLQLMTNGSTLTYEKFVILKFCHKRQETSRLAFTYSKSTMQKLEQCVEYVQI